MDEGSNAGGWLANRPVYRAGGRYHRGPRGGRLVVQGVVGPQESRVGVGKRLPKGCPMRPCGYEDERQSQGAALQQSKMIGLGEMRAAARGCREGGFGAWAAGRA